MPMPLHYAATDALVALFGSWGAWRLGRTGQWAGAVGIALFGLAGAIGTVRIAGGLDSQLAALHRLASLTGGLVGLILILMQLRAGTGALPRWWHIALASIATAGLSIVIPSAGAALFVVGLVGGSWLVWRGSGRGQGSGQRHLAAALGFALMLPTVLFVRASPYLSTDAAWHAYHLLVASWLWIVVLILQDRQSHTVWQAARD